MAHILLHCEVPRVLWNVFQPGWDGMGRAQKNRVSFCCLKRGRWLSKNHSSAENGSYLPHKVYLEEQK